MKSNTAFSSSTPCPWLRRTWLPTRWTITRTPRLIVRSHGRDAGRIVRQITLAESFEEDLDLRSGHRYYPIRPTEEFLADALAIHVVFRVFKHYSAYQVIGRLFPDNVPGLSGATFTDEEIAYLAVEDESGYLKFFAPSQAGWMPGLYRIDIFVGYEANEVTRMGTLRFTVTPKA